MTENKKAWVVVICWALATVLVAWFLFFGPGEAIGEDRGFRLYASQTSGEYTFGASNAVATHTWPTNTFQLTYTIPSTGTWYFVLTTYKGDQESSASNEVTDTWTENDEVTFAWDKYFAYQMAGLSTPRSASISLDSTSPLNIAPGATGTLEVEETVK